MKRSPIRELLKVTQQPEVISFAGGLPAPELFPVAEIRQATNALLAREGPRVLQYGETEGVGALRDWIAERYSTSHRQLTRDNVVITTGAQQALDLIGKVFLDPGDRVLVENPTYFALLSAWRSYGATFLWIAGDQDGLRTDLLAATMRTHEAPQPKLLYTIPNFQNPSGVTMGEERRDALVRLTRAHGIGLIEDDPYGELCYDGTVPESLFDREARLWAVPGERGSTAGNVIRVGTFSKVLAPGLRVGWIIAPGVAIEKLVQAKQAVDLHTSSLCQHLILELVQSGVLAWQIQRLRDAYRERRDAMLAALERAFPADSGIRWSRPAGGMFLMVTLPKGVDAAKLLEKTLANGVAFIPGRDLHLEHGWENTLRLNFSNATPERIETGIRRLAAAVRTMLPISTPVR